MLTAMIEIHKNNVIHCDIKPQNFLPFYSDDELKSCEECSFDMSTCSYDPACYLKITDFGMAHLIPSGSTKAYMKFCCGTFGYRAPEIINVRYIIEDNILF
jgi:serine/threonine protein kinase